MERDEREPAFHRWAEAGMPGTFREWVAARMPESFLRWYEAGAVGVPSVAALKLSDEDAQALWKARKPEFDPLAPWTEVDEALAYWVDGLRAEDLPPGSFEFRQGVTVDGPAFLQALQDEAWDGRYSPRSFYGALQADLVALKMALTLWFGGVTPQLTPPGSVGLLGAGDGFTG